MSRVNRDVPAGYKEIFVPYFRHHKTKQKIYPKKGKVFRFLVKTKD